MPLHILKKQQQNLNLRHKELKNTWQLFDSKIPKPEELEEKIVIAHRSKIGETEYILKNTIIRKFKIIEEVVAVGMFEEKHKQIFY